MPESDLSERGQRILRDAVKQLSKAKKAKGGARSPSDAATEYAQLAVQQMQPPLPAKESKRLMQLVAEACAEHAGESAALVTPQSAGTAQSRMLGKEQGWTVKRAADEGWAMLREKQHLLSERCFIQALLCGGSTADRAPATQGLATVINLVGLRPPPLRWHSDHEMERKVLGALATLRTSPRLVRPVNDVVCAGLMIQFARRMRHLAGIRGRGTASPVVAAFNGNVNAVSAVLRYGAVSEAGAISLRMVGCRKDRAKWLKDFAVLGLALPGKAWVDDAHAALTTRGVLGDLGVKVAGLCQAGEDLSDLSQERVATVCPQSTAENVMCSIRNVPRPVAGHDSRVTTPCGRLDRPTLSLYEPCSFLPLFVIVGACEPERQECLRVAERFISVVTDTVLGEWPAVPPTERDAEEAARRKEARIGVRSRRSHAKQLAKAMLASLMRGLPPRPCETDWERSEAAVLRGTVETELCNLAAAVVDAAEWEIVQREFSALQGATSKDDGLLSVCRRLLGEKATTAIKWALAGNFVRAEPLDPQPKPPPVGYPPPPGTPRSNPGVPAHVMWSCNAALRTCARGDAHFVKAQAQATGDKDSRPATMHDVNRLYGLGGFGRLRGTREQVDADDAQDMTESRGFSLDELCREVHTPSVECLFGVYGYPDCDGRMDIRRSSRVKVVDTGDSRYITSVVNPHARRDITLGCEGLIVSCYAAGVGDKTAAWANFIRDPVEEDIFIERSPAGKEEDKEWSCGMIVEEGLVTDITQGGPADQARMLSGAAIIAIDDVPCLWGVDDIPDLLNQGPRALICVRVRHQPLHVKCSRLQVISAPPPPVLKPLSEEMQVWGLPIPQHLGGGEARFQVFGPPGYLRAGRTAKPLPFLIAFPGGSGDRQSEWLQYWGVERRGWAMAMPLLPRNKSTALWSSASPELVRLLCYRLLRDYSVENGRFHAFGGRTTGSSAALHWAVTCPGLFSSLVVLQGMFIANDFRLAHGLYGMSVVLLSTAIRETSRNHGRECFRTLQLTGQHPQPSLVVCPDTAADEMHIDVDTLFSFFEKARPVRHAFWGTTQNWMVQLQHMRNIRARWHNASPAEQRWYRCSWHEYFDHAPEMAPPDGKGRSAGDGYVAPRCSGCLGMGVVPGGKKDWNPCDYTRCTMCSGSGSGAGGLRTDRG
eukprot:Hpha_TRINITY_DN15424_c0_g1::TRINITY_DN15424_c0_g1_i1::g.173104::m.173104